MTEILTMIGALELPFIGAITPEFLLFAMAIAFFGFSAGLCALAVRAAGSARAAEDDARVMMRTVKDYAAEVRELAAQTERFAYKGAAETEAGLSERIQSAALSDRAEAHLADDDAAEAADGNADGQTVFDPDANARLAEAGRAATEPRSLLSGLLRRR